MNEIDYYFSMDIRKRINPNLEVLVKSNKEALKPPRLYSVFLLNDDYTPMNFVVEVLMKYFYMPKEVAELVMMQVHQKGRAHCGLFTRDIAETKVVQVNEYSRRNHHPLLCGIDNYR